MEKGDVIVKSFADRKPPVTKVTVLDSHQRFKNENS